MPVAADVLVEALRFPAGTSVDFEPLGTRPGSPQRVTLRPPGAPPAVVLLREPAEPGVGANHVAIMQALASVGFPYAPRLLGVIAGASVETWVEGSLALGLLPPPGSCEAAVDALAAFHTLQIREGLDWECDPATLLPGPGFPLHRLGFAAHERAPAADALALARAALLLSPFGFAHRDATAAHVLLAPGSATLVSFSRAGFGPQLFDLAAFLVTAGLDPSARRALALRYAASRSFEPEATADLADLAGICWSLATLLSVPRRLVESLGDDAETAALTTAAERIDRSLRTPSGNHPAALALRAALWPA